MKTLKDWIIVVFSICIFLLVIKVYFDKNTSFSQQIEAQSEIPKKDLLQKSVCNQEKFESGFWYVRMDGVERRLSYTIYPTKLENVVQNQGETLNIFDESGNKIYEEKASYFAGFMQETVLAKVSPQLIIKSVNYGGSGRFLKVLDYRNGKVVDLTEDVDTLYDAFAEIRPQFQKGSKTISEPYQILLTSPGLSSPTYQTRVIKYINGKYIEVGAFPQQKVDAIVESIIDANKQNF